MGTTGIAIILATSIITVAFALANFKKTLFAWILLAGGVGVPLLVVRQSSLMFSEAALVPLLVVWIMDRKLGIKILRLPDSHSPTLAIEKAMWGVIWAFMISAFFGILFDDLVMPDRHSFLAGKMMALFLYVAPVLTAFMVADSVRSFQDARRICILMVCLGLFSLIVQFTDEESFLRVLQEEVGWSWLCVSALFAFSVAQMVSDAPFPKRLLSAIVAFVSGAQVFVSYFLGTVTYKALILTNFFVVLSVLYYKSRAIAVLAVAAATLVFFATFVVFENYLKEETNQGSWGAHGGSRLAVWEQTFLVFMEKPLFGVGPYNYYDYSLYVSSKKRSVNENWGVMTSPHGQYFQILAETGIIGTLAFFWLLKELFKMLKGFLALGSLSTGMKVIISGFAAIIVSRLAAGILGDYVIPQYHNGGLQTFCSTIYFWISLGALIGLRKNVLPQTKEQKTTDVLVLKR